LVLSKVWGNALTKSSPISKRMRSVMLEMDILSLTHLTMGGAHVAQIKMMLQVKSLQQSLKIVGSTKSMMTFSLHMKGVTKH
jgi:predicted SpoU family rRNA methylase